MQLQITAIIDITPTTGFNLNSLTHTIHEALDSALSNPISKTINYLNDVQRVSITPYDLCIPLNHKLIPNK